MELGESVQHALIQEWEEEIGTPCSIEKSLGVIENQWKDENTQHYEINHVFNLNSDILEVETNPTSKESHLKFYRIVPDKENLRIHKVMPDTVVQTLIKKVQEQNIESYWVSTL
ncbi:DNA mismatch repair protein MutT [Bacillus cereus]|uniref:DNA mismatch repair protein MutT n=1 Tax=Bacillus cereus TaxID=1396 RepID=UPI00356F7312